MNRNYVIGIVILAVIIIVGWAFFGSSNPVPSVDMNVSGSLDQSNTGTATSSAPNTNIVPSGTVEVTFGDNGFNPAKVTIKKGQTVRFTNNSSELMWVASNPHPIHTDYSEFDEKTSVSAGGSYEFAFTKVGIWSYHNHKDPSKNGQIMVQ